MKHKILMATIFLFIVNGISLANSTEKSVERNGLKYPILEIDSLTRDVQPSVFKIQYNKSKFLAKFTASLVSTNGCEMNKFEGNSKGSFNNLTKEIGWHFKFGKINPSLRDFNYTALLSHNSNLDKFFDVQGECKRYINERDLNGSTDAHPLFVIFGFVYQNKLENEKYSEPYFIVHDIIFAQDTTESYWSGGINSIDIISIIAKLALKKL